MRVLKFLTVTSVFALASCGTLRDDMGTVHDASYNSNQAKNMVTEAPLLVPFVPLGISGNAVKASAENGEIAISGPIVDEQGLPQRDVQVDVQRATLVNFDLGNDHPIFSETSATKRCDGAFQFHDLGIHTLKLAFSKPGYVPSIYHVELVRDQAPQWDKASSDAIQISGVSPLKQTELVVVLKKATATVQ